MAIPAAFLPFDPTRDYDESDQEDDELCSESDEDDTSDKNHVQDSISNGDDHQDRKQSRHIGGGVLLVNKFFHSCFNDKEKTSFPRLGFS